MANAPKMSIARRRKMAQQRTDVRRYTANILKTLDCVTIAEMAEGLNWYATAEAAADALAAQYSIAPNVAACVIASTSPQTIWGRNVAASALIIAAWANGASRPPRSSGTLASNASRAWDVLTTAFYGGDLIDAIRPHGDGTAPKITRFWRNITGDVNCVTVDIWAARAANANPRLSGNWLTPLRYRLVEEAYQRAASIASIAPRDCQAAVWVHYRGKHGKVFS